MYPNLTQTEDQMYKQLVSFDERREIVEGKHFIEYGDKMKYQIVDLKWLCDRIRKERNEKHMSPYVDIIPIKEEIHKNITLSFPFAKDIETGILYGIFNGLYEDGGIKWNKILIMDHLNLNLNRDQDLKYFAVLRYWPKLAGSPWQLSTPVFKLYDPEIEASNSIEEDDALIKALGRIKELKGQSMAWFARSLGISVIQGVSPKVLRMEISKNAKNNPVEFNKRFDSVDRDVAETFYNANMLGVITFDVSTGYMFRKLPIGGNENSAIQYLREYPEVMREIHRETEARDAASRELVNMEPALDAKTTVKEAKKTSKTAAEISNDDF